MMYPFAQQLNVQGNSRCAIRNGIRQAMNRDGMKGRMMMVKLFGAIAGVCLLATAAASDEIATRSELDDLLSGSEEYLEDFEQVSLHAGTVYPLPNPLNEKTASSVWPGLLPEVTYSADNSLTMYAGFLWGDDSNILRGDGNFTITFDYPQLAVGFDLTGFGFNHTVTFYHDDEVLSVWSIDMTSSVRFAGWQEFAGITSVHIESTNGGSPQVTAIDNIAWGVPIGHCPGDVTLDGDVDVPDLLAVLAAWGSCNCIEDVDLDGQVGVTDLLTVLADWGPCPEP